MKTTNNLLKRDLGQLERCLSGTEAPGTTSLHRMYDLTLKLQSQIVGVIYDREDFGVSGGQDHFAVRRSSGENSDSVVTLTLREPLPSMKKMTQAIEAH